jgi:hypothetical protein
MAKRRNKRYVDTDMSFFLKNWLGLLFRLHDSHEIGATNCFVTFRHVVLDHNLALETLGHGKRYELYTRPWCISVTMVVGLDSPSSPRQNE